MLSRFGIPKRLLGAQPNVTEPTPRTSGPPASNAAGSGGEGGGGGGTGGPLLVSTRRDSVPPTPPRASTASQSHSEKVSPPAKRSSISSGHSASPASIRRGDPSSSSSSTTTNNNNANPRSPTIESPRRPPLPSPTGPTTAPTESGASATNRPSSPQRSMSRPPGGGPGEGSDGTDLIKVGVRVRPLVRDEREELITWCWEENRIYSVPAARKAGSQMVAEPNPSTQGNYAFDHLFQPDSTNQQIFGQMVKDIVRSAMNGYHGSVFCYGQTSTGKTFTMNGSQHQPGIIAQAVELCFNAVEGAPDREFLFRMSYLEVYNEQVKDLLSAEPTQIKIQFDPKQGTVLSGVKEQVVLSAQQVMALIRAGEAQRHVSSTDMNEKSSRAHTLFRITIESKERSHHNAPVRHSTLNLIDLAGSESARLTNAKGERAREAKFINQSLLTLSLIIHRLSEDRGTQSKNASGGRTQHLPYRDSKLTRLLESALDGNARIAIICTISPAARCAEETNNTLKFAARAKLIKMNAKVNENMDDKTLLRAYREEIEQLRTRLRELEARNTLRDSQSLPAPIGGSDASLDNGLSVSSTESESPLSSQSQAKDEERNMMLQMISEMERLILKADATHKVVATKKPGNGTATPAMTPRTMSKRRLLSAKSMSNVFSSSSSSLNSLVGTSLKRESSKIDVVKEEEEEEEKAKEKAREAADGQSEKAAVNFMPPAPAVAPAKPKPSLIIRTHSGIPRMNPTASSAPSTSVTAALTAEEGSAGGGSASGENGGGAASGLPQYRPSFGRTQSMSAKDLLEAYHHLTNTPNTSALKTRISPMRQMSTPSTLSKLVIENFDEEGTEGDMVEGSNPMRSYLSPFGPSSHANTVVEEDSVLISVSSMLTMLKDFITKPHAGGAGGDGKMAGSEGDGDHNGSHPPSVPPSPDINSSVRNSVRASLALKDFPLSPISRPRVPPSPAGAAASSFSDNDLVVPRALYDQIRTDLKLKEADSRFLQAEVEQKDLQLSKVREELRQVRAEVHQKDELLSRLTDGLKEVEATQLSWLSANQELSNELQRAYRVNEMMHKEVQRLTYLLYGDPDSSVDTTSGDVRDGLTSNQSLSSPILRRSKRRYRGQQREEEEEFGEEEVVAKGDDVFNTSWMSQKPVLVTPRRLLSAEILGEVNSPRQSQQSEQQSKQQQQQQQEQQEQQQPRQQGGEGQALRGNGNNNGSNNDNDKGLGDDCSATATTATATAAVATTTAIVTSVAVATAGEEGEAPSPPEAVAVVANGHSQPVAAAQQIESDLPAAPAAPSLQKEVEQMVLVEVEQVRAMPSTASSAAEA
eukprot:gene3725-4074_t